MISCFATLFVVVLVVVSQFRVSCLLIRSITSKENWSLIWFDWVSMSKIWFDLWQKATNRHTQCCHEWAWLKPNQTDQDRLLRVIHVQVVGIRRSSPNDKLNETWHVYNFSFYELGKRMKPKQQQQPSSVWNVISLFLVFHSSTLICASLEQLLLLLLHHHLFIRLPLYLSFLSRTHDLSLFDPSMQQIVTHFGRVFFVSLVHVIKSVWRV